jgi:F-type H+-transporting ATPase subunit delta
MAAFVSRYANAFADVVTAAKLDTVAVDQKLTDFLATWTGSPELRNFFENPAIAVNEKVAILDKLNAKIGMQKELRNLIAVLISNNRIAQVSEVAESYRRLLQEQMGVHSAEIVTARELDAKEREALLAEVSKLAGGKVEARFKLDASILGGTVVRLGSTVYDGSVRGRLDRLRDSLIAG